MSRPWYYIPEIQEYAVPVDDALPHRATYRCGAISLHIRSQIPMVRILSERIHRHFVLEGKTAQNTSFHLDILVETQRPWFVNPAEFARIPEGIIRPPGTERISSLLHYHVATRLDWAARHAVARVVASAPAPRLQWEFGSVLRYWFNQAAPSAGMIFLHGAAVEIGRQAFVLLGPSGAGKSTASHIARWSGRKVWCDELVGIWKEEHAWKVCGSPFGGSLSAPGEARLTGVARLHQGPQDRLESMPPRDALAYLGAAAQYGAFFPNANAEDVMRTLALAVAELPCYHLHFTPGEEFLRLLEGVAT